MVQGLGDIANNWSNPTEWDLAETAWEALKGKVPYMPVMGNHDDPDTMNQRFNVSEFNTQPYGGDSLNGNSENNYLNFNIGGQGYMFLQVEPYDQYSEYRPEGLEWAKKVLENNPDKKVILATHDTWDTDTTKNELLTKYDNIIMSNAGYTGARE